MRALVRREKIILLCCVATVAVYLVTEGVVKPFFLKLSSVDAQVTAAVHQLDKDRRVIAKAGQLNERYAFYRAKFASKGSDEAVPMAMIAQIEAAAGQFKMKIADIKPKTVQRVDQLRICSVSLVIAASLKDLIAFVEVLQRDPFYFGVDDVMAERLSYDDGDMLSFRLSLTTLALPE